MTESGLESRIKAEARRLGFHHVGIAATQDAETFPAFQAWLAAGYAGDMSYLSKHEEARRHPRSIQADVKSLILGAMNYNPGSQRSSSMPGRIARYAQGTDYHDLLRDRLKQLLGWLQEERPTVRGRAVVDTAPLLERDFARRAGLGWFGKNTMLLHRTLGSYFLLGVLLVDIELQPDPATIANHCGSCTACLEACPTQAFPVPGVLDARKCISYLTIELRDAIPTELRSGVGSWLFGCDVCQEVCPWNRKAPMTDEAAFVYSVPPLDPAGWFRLTPEEFRRLFRNTPLSRPGRDGMLRNLAIVLGNQADPNAIPALAIGLNDPNEVVRGACAWALGRIGGTDARHALDQREKIETVETVCEEIRQASTFGLAPGHEPGAKRVARNR